VSIDSNFKIRLAGGIGDCLRSISRHPMLASFTEQSKFKIFWTYGITGDLGWTQLLRDDVFGRNSSFIYIPPEIFNFVSLPELFSGSYGDVVLSSSMSRLNFCNGFSLKLNDAELALLNSINFDESKFNVGIQISGNDKLKHWPVNNYIRLINHIHGLYPESHVYIMDSPSRHFPSKGYDNSRVTNLIGLSSISFNIELIKRLSLWVPPDSYSKYVANWIKVRQIILCCKLPYIETGHMIKSCFEEVGITRGPVNKLVGIDFDSDGNVISYIEDISLIPFELVSMAFDELSKD
jgi:hypothetical protein